MGWNRVRFDHLAMTVLALFAAGLVTAARSSAMDVPEAAGTGGMDRPDFLVVIRDRGQSGNREVADLLAGVEKDFPLALLHIGDDGQGVEDGYRGEIDAAARTLRKAGVDRIVAIPFFPFGDARLLAEFRDPVARSVAPLPLEWAPPLADSYLFEEILRDRFGALDPDGTAAHWILLDEAPDPDMARSWRDRTATVGDHLAVLLGWAAPPHVAALLDEKAAAAADWNKAFSPNCGRTPPRGRRSPSCPR